MSDLVEREPALVLLSDAIDRKAPFVLVAGEAGSGKTSLVRALLARQPTGSWVLGGCDGLHTARPRGPLLEWGGDVDDVLARVRVAVVEDLHWADDATLDALARLARHSGQGRATVLLTYRDDEVGPGHPVRLLLGDLARTSPVRLAVPPLSPSAVAELAGTHGLPAAELHRRTGGNAFFVSECLATGSLSGSDNVRDAVLARVEHLPPAARVAVEAVCVVPGRCELWLAEALGATGAALDDAVVAGVLVADDRGVALRHELARLTVLESLPPGRRRDLHRTAAHALAQSPGDVDHARVVHHAVLGELPELVGSHAPAAAEVALATGARSQAVAHLGLAWRTAPRGIAQLDVGERWAEQLALVGRQDEAIDAYESAVALARELGDTERAGRLLARSATPLSMAGRMSAAQAVVRAAVQQLEGTAGPAEAYALAERTAQHMLAREFAEAERWAQPALSLAGEVGDVATEAYAAVQSGVARWMDGHDEGLERLRSGIDLARRHALVGLVAQGLSQVGSGGGEIKRYDVALPALEECIAFSDQHELGSRGRYAKVWRGRCLLETGRWDEAAQVLTGLLQSERTETITRLVALTALGRLRARRGDPGAADLLDEALALAVPTGQLQRLWPVAAARAEAAWLRDALDLEVPLLRRVHARARTVDYPWAVDELGTWLQRAGVSEPLTGRTPTTAEQWRALGCPWEAALAETDALPALAELERLGARPAVERLTRERRAAGLSVPRGPNAATLGSPAGLTSRELEVLRLVAQGLTNAGIGEALHLSPKTVGHHVGHVLDKLGARSRAEAVARATELAVPLR